MKSLHTFIPMHTNDIRKYSNSTRIQYNLHSIINILFIQSSDQAHPSDLICEKYSLLGDIIINVFLLPPDSGCVWGGHVSSACLKILMCCFYRENLIWHSEYIKMCLLVRPSGLELSDIHSIRHWVSPICCLSNATPRGTGESDGMRSNSILLSFTIGTLFLNQQRIEDIRRVATMV